MIREDLDAAQVYRDDVGVMRCGNCQRPLMDHAGELLVTIRAKDLTNLLTSLSATCTLSRGLVDSFEADLAAP